MNLQQLSDLTVQRGIPQQTDLGISEQAAKQQPQERSEFHHLTTYRKW
jgi:hypothetical protein